MFQPLLAFGFESLPMLGWLAAAAAPWLIHLLARRKYRETAWAAMEILLRAARRRTRRIQLEQLLLLLVRTLAVISVVLAMAQPFIERAGPIFRPSGSTHRVLVVDSSYSMGYRATDRSRFELARQCAARIVEQSLPGDGFTLVQMADPPRVIVATPTFEAEPIQAEIKNLEMLHTGADLAATLAKVEEVIRRAGDESPTLKRCEVYFLSDLQKSTWLPAMSETAHADFQAASARLARNAFLRVIDLGQPGDENLAVSGLEVRAPVVLAGRSVEFEVALREFGRGAHLRQAVDLFVDGHPAGRQYVDLPAGGSGVARFRHRFEAAGEHALEVRADGDALEPDNRRFLVLDVRRAIRVLCIDGRPSGDPRRGSVYHLSNALLAHGGSERSPIEVDLAAENAILERNLGLYDCVVLSNVARFTASEARVLDNYREHGGSLVFFLGDRVSADDYNRVLVDVPRPVLPARLVAEAKNPPGGGLDPRDYRHPIVQAFRGQEKAGLLSSPVGRYFKLAVKKPGEAASPAADVALALGNGDPLIVVQAGRGRVVLVATSADASWALLPKWGTYLPLVKQIVAWCTAGQAQPRNFGVGEPLSASFGAAAAASNLSMECPDGRRVPVLLEAQGDGVAWHYGDTLVSGIYTAHAGPPLARSQLFAVNLSTAESDLSTISREQLEGDVWPGIPIDFATSPQAAGARLTQPAGPAGSLHVGLLCLAVVLLVLDSLLAWRFGYYPQ